MRNICIYICKGEKVWKGFEEKNLIVRLMDDDTMLKFGDKNCKDMLERLRGH